MTEKVEWEVVDRTDNNANADGMGGNSGAGARRPGPAPEQLLGRWWRWKVAGMLTLGALALILLVTLAGMLALGLASVALLSYGAARLSRWLRGGSSLAVRNPH